MGTTSTLDQAGFEAALQRLGRRARIVGVVVLDLSGTVDDEVLLRADAAVRASVRPKDALTRVGHRFVVLLPGCASGRVAQVACRVRDAVVAVDGSAPLVATIGIAHGTGLDLPDVLRTADEDLRRATWRADRTS